MHSVISLGDTVKLSKWNNNNIMNNSYIILKKYNQAFFSLFSCCFFCCLFIICGITNLKCDTSKRLLLTGHKQSSSVICWVSYCICLEGLSYWRLQVNSDRSTTRVSFQFALFAFLSQRENSSLDRDSLSTLSHLHLFFLGSWPHSSESCCHCWSRASSLWLV